MSALRVFYCTDYNFKSEWHGKDMAVHYPFFGKVPGLLCPQTYGPSRTICPFFQFFTSRDGRREHPLVEIHDLVFFNNMN